MYVPKDFLVVDYEFTQYTRRIGRPRGFFSEIIEIGAVKIDGETGQVVGKLQDFVIPHFYPKQAKEALDFCMITDKDMEKAVPFKTMIEEMKKVYEKGKTWFVAWGGEDYHVLSEGCKRHKIENPIDFDDYLDLAEAYKLMKGDNYTTGLKKATEEQDVDAGGLWHTAFDDAANTGKLLLKLMENGWSVEQYHEQREEAARQKEELARAKHDAWIARMEASRKNRA